MWVFSILILEVSHFSRKGNIVVATELARRYGDQGITVTSLNPGDSGYGLPEEAY